MKIKTDFITNSSSTAYVVFIPNNFKPEKEKVLKLINDHLYDDGVEWDEQTYDEKVDEFYELIETLKDSTDIWTYGGDGTDSILYYSIHQLCEDCGFIVSSSGMGGEGNNTIMSIKQEDVTDILFKYLDFEEILETVNGGNKL